MKTFFYLVALLALIMAIAILYNLVTGQVRPDTEIAAIYAFLAMIASSAIITIQTHRAQL